MQQKLTLTLSGWRARELTRYGQFKGVRIRYMGPQLICGGSCLTPDSKSRNSFDLTKIFKRLPPHVFLVVIFDQLSQKQTVFVPQRPRHRPPILCYGAANYKRTSVNHQQPPTPPPPRSNRRDLICRQQEDRAIVSPNEFGHWRPSMTPCPIEICETRARELSRITITWVAQPTKDVWQFLNLSGNKALICDVPTSAQRDRYAERIERNIIHVSHSL